MWRLVGTAAVECSSDANVTLTVTLGSGAGALAHTAVVAVDCEQQGSISGLEDAAAAGRGTVTATDGFNVSTAAARCTAEPAAAKVTAGIGGSRTVSLGLSAVPGEVVSSAVRVDCTPPGHAPVTATATFAAAYADSCDDPLGALADGVTARSGRVVRNAACVSPQRVRDGGSAKRYWARRHTFTLGLPAVLRVDAASPTRGGLDAYVLVLGGHAQDGTGTVLGRDDNSGPSSGARLAGLRLEPGDYTVEVTTAKKRHTGGYRLRVQARLGVRIEDLNGSSRIGTGTAVDHFTVLPPDAACTPDTGNITDLGDGQRTLTADLTAPGDTTVTVTCRRAGYRTATATTTLTALDPINDVTIAAAADGSCTTFTGPLESGIDSKYACTMTRGQTMTLQADATGPSSRTTLGWAAAVGARAVPSLGDLDASVLGDTVTFTRTGTATVTCTSHGRVTVTARIGAAVHHTTEIAVTCQPPVQITDYTPGTRNGPGPITGTYHVTPATARCTARNAGGITGTPIPGGTGTARTVTVTATARTVTVTATATGTLDIEIECRNTGHATSTATAQFRADDQTACSTDLGALRHGTRIEFGTLAQDITRLGCKSFRRDAANPQDVYYVQRYTFSMATAGWVSALLEAAGRVVSPIDPYLLVLYGHGSGGAERARDDNSGVGDRAQLSNLFLAAGNYTIEATTASAGDGGSYRLSVDADFAAQAPDQPARIDARVGQPITRGWSYLPADAAATVQSITPFGLAAAVTSDQGNATLAATATRAGDYTVTVAYTASGHTSTIATTVKILCPPRHVATTTRTCTPLATTPPAGCAMTSLNTNGYWGANAVIKRYSAYSTKAPAGCESLSESGSAAYFRFTVPDRPGRLPVRVAVDSAEPRGGPIQVFADGGNPTLTLWAESHSSLSFKAHASAYAPQGLFVALDLSPGTYVVEVAPSQRVARPNDRFSVTAIVPTGERQYEEVQRFGHTGDVVTQATLDEFLQVRAEEHLNYPYLTWTSDDCTGVRDEWTYWREATPADYAANQNTGAWVSITIPVYRACWRHDFNWRNLARIEHYVDSRVDSWNQRARDDADDQFELDLRVVCDDYLQSSLWQDAGVKCYSNAGAYRWGVSNLGFVTPSPDIGPPQRIR